MAAKTQRPHDVQEHFGNVLQVKAEECTLTVCLGSLSGRQEEPRIEQLHV
jgi:hypothetical protein